MLTRRISQELTGQEGPQTPVATAATGICGQNLARATEITPFSHLVEVAEDLPREQEVPLAEDEDFRVLDADAFGSMTISDKTKYRYKNIITTL